MMTANTLRAVTVGVEQLPWVEVLPGLKVKALTVDEGRHAIEFLMQADHSWRPGPHRHVCETSLLVLDGGINNVGKAVSYKKGDFFYQEAGNTHVEEMAEEGLVAYVSMRGSSDVLVEFLSDQGEVQGTMNVSHFSSLLAA